MTYSVSFFIFASYLLVLTAFFSIIFVCTLTDPLIFILGFLLPPALTLICLIFPIFLVVFLVDFVQGFSQRKRSRVGGGQWEAKNVFVFRRLFLWREKEAEERDESPSYICRGSLLLDAAEYLPVTVSALMKIQTPLPASMRALNPNHSDTMNLLRIGKKEVDLVSALKDTLVSWEAVVKKQLAVSDKGDAEKEKHNSKHNPHVNNDRYNDKNNDKNTDKYHDKNNNKNEDKKDDKNNDKNSDEYDHVSKKTIMSSAMLLVRTSTVSEATEEKEEKEEKGKIELGNLGNLGKVREGDGEGKGGVRHVLIPTKTVEDVGTVETACLGEKQSESSHAEAVEDAEAAEGVAGEAGVAVSLMKASSRDAEIVAHSVDRDTDNVANNASPSFPSSSPSSSSPFSLPSPMVLLGMSSIVVVALYLIRSRQK